jgi:thiol:disulfide interchange protein
MPPRKPSRKQPPPKRKALWFGIAAVVLAAGALAFYWSRPAPTPAPVAPAEAPAIATPPVPIETRHIYSETANPSADIAAGLAEAKREHKRVILDFGGDWCGDCQVLDIYFHQPPNLDLLQKNFVLVHVWIGQMDANLGVAAKYGVPIAKGVPALAVLGANGKVLYAQATGEFRDMRHMDSASVTSFLETWKS